LRTEAAGREVAIVFSDAEKTDIRRYCGYPVYGNAASGSLGWRFYQAYGLLEYRMQNLTDAEEAVTRTQLGVLAGLETALAQSSTNLDTESAANWTRNPNEPGDRARLFDDLRRRLCAFLGLPPGPGLVPGGGVVLLV
jgi:hypothetical protein